MFGRAFSGHFLVLDRDIETKNTFGFYFYKPEQMLEPGETSRRCGCSSPACPR